jgi:membrane associated rhomboid family serine protease
LLGLVLVDLYLGISGKSILVVEELHFAHVGGALFGFIIMWYWKKISSIKTDGIKKNNFFRQLKSATKY